MIIIQTDDINFWCFVLLVSNCSIQPINKIKKKLETQNNYFSDFIVFHMLILHQGLNAHERFCKNMKIVANEAHINRRQNDVLSINSPLIM